MKTLTKVALDSAPVGAVAKDFDGMAWNKLPGGLWRNADSGFRANSSWLSKREPVKAAHYVPEPR
jgi:hypothetical protein